MRVDHCRSCGAPVVWTITAKGKRMPVDAEPSDIGTIELRAAGDVIYSTAVAGGTIELPGVAGPRHTSHFATCPEANAWRRR